MSEMVKSHFQHRLTTEIAGSADDASKPNKSLNMSSNK